MRLKKLNLYNWRNFASQSLDLSPGVTFVHGANGVGKTNLLEAIWYLAYARSFRKTNDANLIRAGESNAAIEGFFSMEDDYEKKIDVKIAKTGKEIDVDGKKIKALSNYVGTILIASFDPKKVFFFKGEPNERRRMMDETLSAIDENYLYSLTRYKKLLKERNQAIYQHSDSDVINVFTQELIKVSFPIAQKRLALVKYVNEKAGAYFKELFQSDAKLMFKYKTNVAICEDLKTYQEAMTKLFEERKSYEMIRKSTMIGIHLDDLVGYLNDLSIANFASQGQNRLASLSLTFALKDLMQEKKKQVPILILDDVLSDLDEAKKKLVCEKVKSMGQVLISGNDDSIYEGFDAVLIQDGKIIHKGE